MLFRSISISQARQLHMHMLVYTIGLGAIFSVTTPGIPIEEIYAQQEQAYEAFFCASHSAAMPRTFKEGFFNGT